MERTRESGESFHPTHKLPLHIPQNGLYSQPALKSTAYQSSLISCFPPPPLLGPNEELHCSWVFWKWKPVNFLRLSYFTQKFKLNARSKIHLKAERSKSTIAMLVHICPDVPGARQKAATTYTWSTIRVEFLLTKYEYWGNLMEGGKFHWSN